MNLRNIDPFKRIVREPEPEPPDNIVQFPEGELSDADVNYPVAATGGLKLDLKHGRVANDLDEDAFEGGTCFWCGESGGHAATECPAAGGLRK